jgi:hypothetical protein
MKKPDVQEAVPMLDRVMRELLRVVQSSPSTRLDLMDPKEVLLGANVRRAVGDLLAHSAEWLSYDQAGEPMALCYEQARKAGVTFVRFLEVIRFTALESPKTDGALLTRNACISFALSSACRVIADTKFRSRQEVSQVRDNLASLFAVVEEAAADSMDPMAYRSLVTLHAAIMAHLLDTARPLPRLTQFHFAQSLPSLVIAYRLYDDASRCDELREENHVVHPAFMRKDGIALSA